MPHIHSTRTLMRIPLPPSGTHKSLTRIEHIFSENVFKCKNLFFECGPNVDCFHAHILHLCTSNCTSLHKSKSQPGDGDMKGKGTTTDEEAVNEGWAQVSTWGTEISYGKPEAEKLLRGEEVLGWTSLHITHICVKPTQLLNHGVLSVLGVWVLGLGFLLDRWSAGYTHENTVTASYKN